MLEARQAVDDLCRRLDQLEVAIANVVDAWADIDHTDRVDIGHQWPRLTDALLAAEWQRREE